MGGLAPSSQQGGRGTPHIIRSSLPRLGQQPGPKWFQAAATSSRVVVCRAERSPPARGWPEPPRQRAGQLLVGHQGVVNDPGPAVGGSFWSCAAPPGRTGPQALRLRPGRCGHRSDPPPGEKSNGRLPGWRLSVETGPSSAFRGWAAPRRSEPQRLSELTSRIAFGRFQVFRAMIHAVATRRFVQASPSGSPSSSLFVSPGPWNRSSQRFRRWPALLARRGCEPLR